MLPNVTKTSLTKTKANIKRDLPEQTTYPMQYVKFINSGHKL